MYRESNAEIKRNVTITEPEPLEIEIIIRVRGNLKPDQIKSIAEIADAAAEQTINVSRATETKDIPAADTNQKNAAPELTQEMVNEYMSMLATCPKDQT